MKPWTILLLLVLAATQLPATPMALAEQPTSTTPTAVTSSSEHPSPALTTEAITILPSSAVTPSPNTSVTNLPTEQSTNTAALTNIGSTSSQLLNLELHNAELREAFTALGRLSQRNIIIDEQVQGRVSVHLQQVTLQQALHSLTASQGLAYKEQESIIYISTQERQVLLQPQLYIYQLRYLQAQQLLPQLQNLLSYGKLVADVPTNTLILQGAPQEQARLQQVLQQLDQPAQQITLEAKIIAVNRERLQQLGLSWAWDKIPQRTTATDGSSTSEGPTESNPYGGNFKFWRGYSFRFHTTLNALLAKGQAKVLATPRLLTLPGHQASIFIGDHIPVQTERHSSSGSYLSTEYIDAGIKLQYTPLLSPEDGMITAAVHTEVSTPTLISELKNYRVTSRTADTHVRLRHGETLVIGGLINEEEQRSLQAVPLLSKLPLLGNLFKNSTRQRTQVEVLLLLTPYITPAGTAPEIYKQPEELLKQGER